MNLQIPSLDTVSHGGRTVKRPFRKPLLFFFFFNDALKTRPLAMNVSCCFDGCDTTANNAISILMLSQPVMQ